jgi:hypothetical protein
VPIFLKSGSLNLPEPSGPVQVCTGIALQLNGTKHYLENLHFFSNNYFHIKTDGVSLIKPSSGDRTGIRLELLMAGNYKVRKGVASNDEMLKTNGCPCA